MAQLVPRQPVQGCARSNDGRQAWRKRGDRAAGRRVQHGPADGQGQVATLRPPRHYCHAAWHDCMSNLPWAPIVENHLYAKGLPPEAFCIVASCEASGDQPHDIAQLCACAIISVLHRRDRSAYGLAVWSRSERAFCATLDLPCPPGART
ncbi:hypothetical protein XAP6164_2600039 [Xanthomonas phaseoli pv. phaseoli]|nr:hypothetical protein XAP6164_2600039 [Xanthomonas phaseoli pv. phaseoli]